MKRSSSYFLLFFVFATSLSCRFAGEEVSFKNAQKSFRSKKYVEAVQEFDKVLKRKPDTEEALSAAKHAAQITMFHTEQYAKALNYLRFVLLNSKSFKERISAQEKIAFLYFEKLNAYESAIKEFTSLLAINKDKKKSFSYRFPIIKSFYFLDQFDQALMETDFLLKEDLPNSQKFELLQFKATTLIALKKTRDAIDVYQRILAEFPVSSREERIGVSLAVAYEDLNEFEKAIEILEDFRQVYPDTEFIDIKIKRLLQRIANLPRQKRGRR